MILSGCFFSMPASVWRTHTVQLWKTTSGSSFNNLLHLQPLSCTSIFASLCTDESQSVPAFNRVAFMSSTPVSCGSLRILHKWWTTCYSRPFICTTQLSESRATSIKCVSSHYTITYRHKPDVNTHTHALNSTVCWEWALAVATILVFCVWDEQTEWKRETERASKWASVRPFRVLRVGRPFSLLRSRNQQLTCHFCFDSHLWKAGHAHMSKVPLNRILWSQKM